MLDILLSSDHITLCDAILGRISGRVKEKKSGQLLIVPEQYSFDMERRLASLGDETCRYAEVLSLSRLAGRVESIYGGAAELRLDQGGRLLTADLAVDQVFPRLAFYAAFCRKPEFLESFLSAVDEWESYNLLPQDLLDASKRFTGRFAQKLQELGLLYEAYRSACGVARDPILRLRHLCDTLETEDCLSDKELYFYGFSDFTALEHEILENCISGAQNVTLALPYEGKTYEEIFPLTDELLRRLTSFCQEQEIAYHKTELSVERRRPAGLAALQDNLSSFEKQQPAPDDGSVSFLKYRNPEEECRAAAAEIRSLLCSGARCRDIGAACADTSYFTLLRDVFREADIPAFFSGKTSLDANAGVTIVLLALRAIEGGLDGSDVLSYLKSGVAEDESCDALENYALLWKIRGNAWFSPWKMNPSGVKNELSDSESALLNSLNAMREKLLQPLFDLREGLRHSACVADMVRAVYVFTRNISLDEKLLSAAETLRAEGDDAAAQQFEQVYDLLLDALEQLCLVDGEQVKDLESFCALLEKLLARYGVASIPATLDQVLVGDVPSFRGRAVRHLFVLGASEGSFPSCGPDHGIFTESERRQLLDAGIRLAPTRDNVLVREMKGIFQTIRSAEVSVRFSCTEDASSVLLARISVPFGDLRASSSPPTPLNPEEAAGLYLRGGCGEPPAEVASAAVSIRAGLRDDMGTVSKDNLRKLYREPIPLSPTSSDEFAACRFLYFLKRGLHAKPRESAAFDPRQYGSFVHGVLEMTVKEIMRHGGFRTLGEDDWQPYAEAAVDAYVTSYFRDLTDTDQSTCFFIERAKREALLTAKEACEELRQSEFVPFDCELGFGKNGGYPAIQIDGKQSKCALIGTADRVDILKSEDGTYIRVIDYKTGEKEFSFTNLSVGKEMQLILYLNALKSLPISELGEERKSAGVLYQPAKTKIESFTDDPTEEELRDKMAAARKRKGVVVGDISLLSAMEKDLEAPKILPIKRNKNGELVGDKGEILSPQQMQEVENFVRRKLGEIADGIGSGVVTPNPIIQGEKEVSCKYCEFAAVCQKDRLPYEEREIKTIGRKEFFELLEKEETEHG